MIRLASKELCSGCTACMAVCPKQAICMQPDKDGFLYPVIEAPRCVECHYCESCCPVLNPFNIISISEKPICFAAKTKNEDLRNDSSSGGIFTELAKVVIEQAGVVFGCIWQFPEIKAIHSSARTMEELAAMRRSKYVQSDLRNVLQECQHELQKRSQVLFSGTPCQIAGLKHFLGKNYNNLITVEVICHGVPAPNVFEKYKRDMEKQKGEKIREFAFRNIIYSWRRSPFSAVFDSEQEILLGDITTNPYGKAFINNLCLRPSCYNCPCKSGKSQADITLADFWGVENIFPQLDDDKGVSAVIIHSEQAKHLWNQCCNRLESICCELSDITAENTAYIESSSLPHGRRYFMNHYDNGKIADIVNRSLRGFILKYLYQYIKKTTKQFLKKVLTCYNK